jgi:hypothetical protein
MNTTDFYKNSQERKLLEITVNSKKTLNILRDELVSADIDCYIFGDITNDLNGFVFMRIIFNHKNLEHLRKLQLLKIIENIKTIDFEIIEIHLYNEEWNKKNWLWTE